MAPTQEHLSRHLVREFGATSSEQRAGMPWRKLAVFACVLGNYRWRGVDRLWWLPPLMLLWVNLHGSFALGIG